MGNGGGDKWSAIAGGVASAVGSIANLFGQGSANKKNLKVARETNAANASLMAANNAYNSPSSQKARLKAAGLNPDLMYDNGASGLVNTNVPTMQQSAPMQNVAANMASFGSQMASTIKMVAEGISQGIQNSRDRAEDAEFSQNQTLLRDPDTYEIINDLGEWKANNPDKDPVRIILPRFKNVGAFKAWQRRLVNEAEMSENDMRIANARLRTQITNDQRLDPEVRKALKNMPVQEYQNLMKTAREIESRIKLNDANKELAIQEKDLRLWEKECAENSSIGAFIEKLKDPDESASDKAFSILGVFLSILAGRSSFSWSNSTVKKK